MKTVSKLTAVLLTAMTVILLIAGNYITAFSASDISYSVKDGILTVSGNGSVSQSDASSWEKEKSGVSAVVISSGITSIPDDAFVNFNLSYAEIPESVLTIGNHAFGYSLSGGSYSVLGSVSIKGVPGSAAQTWASSNSFTFSDITSDVPSGEIGTVKWELSATGILTVSGSGAVSDFENATDAPWAEYFTEKDGYQVNSVVISDGVTAIGNNAFASANTIASFDIHSSVKTVGENAFSGCAELKSFTSSSITSIGQRAFYGCSSLETVSLGSLQYISASAFDSTPIKSAVFSASCLGIGDGAFRNCKNLSAISISCVTEIGTAAFEGCQSLATASFGKLVSIGDNAFYGCSSLTTFSFPSSLTSIGTFAFSKCSLLSSVSIPRGITVLSEGIFEGCDNLSSIVIPDTVEAIESRALSNCPSLKTISLSKNVRKIADNSIGYYYYSDEKITGVYGKYNDFVLEIKAPAPSVAKNYAIDNKFTYTSTGNVTVDSGKTEDGISWTVKLPAGTILISGTGDMPDFESVSDTPWAVYSSSVSAITLTGVTSIGANSFDGFECVDIINIPSTALKIGENAFRGTAITSLTLPSNLTDIGDGAFENCSSLTSISMPLTIKNIGENCFRATKLSSVYVPSSVEFIGSMAIGYNSLGEKVQSFLIKGAAESVAQYYAKENNISFRVDGYVTLLDPVSGASINMIGSEDDPYNFSVTQIATTLEPDVFLNTTEYALVYQVSMEMDGASVILDGSATISIPIPEGVKALLVKLYTRNSAGRFEEVLVDVSNGCFVYDTTSLGNVIISNCDLTSLRAISVDSIYENGGEVTESCVYYGSEGAHYNISSIQIDGYSANVPSYEGRVGEEDISLQFIYSEEIVTTAEETTTIDTDDNQTHDFTPDIILIGEIVLIILLIIIIVILILVLIRKKRINDTEETSGKRFTTGDRFGDTIVVPHADDGELDVAALFSGAIGDDEEPDDIEFSMEDSGDIKTVEETEEKTEEINLRTGRNNRIITKAELYAATHVSAAPASIIRKRFKGNNFPRPRRTIGRK